MNYQTLRWTGDACGSLRMIDQTLLPTEFREIDCWTVEGVWEAIKVLRVRGAPAIGVAAAYGVVVGLKDHRDDDRSDFNAKLAEVAAYLASSRPTAVNLFWALDRMSSVALEHRDLSSAEVHDCLFAEAGRIDAEDRAMCTAIGQHGHKLLESGMGVLTHCNAGGLATAGDGTALSVIFSAAAAGKSLRVYADETRPLLQGARLTAWELQQREIAVTVICDNMAAQVMKEGLIQAVVTGADRIAANGDAANKIGTYGVALLAKAHDIPFYVAAPSSTFDLSLAHGDHIPIEQRAREEIADGFGRQTVPDGVDVYNPAFDVTPAALIAAIITEHGLIPKPTSEKVRGHLNGHSQVRSSDKAP
ncbi:MAG: S-methyl-5-thioribose-1-phosphate isomerase [Fuerstiella sp.]|nr:S-methyl-5-thioribose-1-phosphate isomerase [Fuerstiella sp.]